MIFREILKMLENGTTPPDCFLTHYAQELRKSDRKVHTDEIVSADINHNILAQTGIVSLWLEIFSKLPQVIFRENLSFNLQSIPKLSTK
jgi:hypothetical protein